MAVPGDPGPSTTVEMDIAPDSPRALIGLVASPIGNANLDLKAPQLLRDGVPVPTLLSADDPARDGHIGLTLAEVTGGATYSIIVAGESSLVGGFRLDVLLPGDVSGDGMVDASELVQLSAAVVQSQFGGNHVSNLFFRQSGVNLSTHMYQEALDANLNGVIDSFDMESARRNIGLTGILIELVSDEEPPQIVAALTPDSGAVDNDGLTNDVNATIAGTITDRSTIATFSGSVDSDDASPFVDLLGPGFFAGHDFESDPNFSLSLSQLEEIAGTGAGSLVNSGPHTIYLVASDDFGAAMPAPVAIPFEFDTVAPDAPSQLTLVDGGTGPISNNTPTFTVDAPDGEMVHLFSSLMDGPIGEVQGDGTVTIIAKELPDGIHEITARTTDAAGNESASSDALQIVVDTGAPGLADFGISPPTTDVDFEGNPLTSDTNVAIVGTTEAGATVALMQGGQTLVTTTSDNSGAFSLDDVELPFGQTEFTLVISDVADNEATFQRIITRGAAPELVAPLGERTLGDEAPGFTVDLSEVFSDADVDGQGDTLTLSASSDTPSLIQVSLDNTILTVSPQPGQLGTATITVRATDSIGLFVEDTLTVTIQLNDAPVVVVPDEVTVRTETEISLPGISVSDVDVDESGLFLSLRAGRRDDSAADLTGLMSVTLVGDVRLSFGSATDSDRITLLGDPTDINATLATLRYKPKPGFSGSTVLTVIANDFGVTGPEDAQEDEKVITITVEPNQAPVANEDHFDAGEDDTLSGNVLADNGNGADVDPDGDDAQLTITNAGELRTAFGATVALSANGDFTYDPTAASTIQTFAEGQTKTDLFEYVVSDGISTSVGTVVIAIAGVNDPPVARDDQFGTDSGSSITGNVLSDNGHGADFDVDIGSTLEVTSVSEIVTDLGVRVTVDASGDFSYDPLESATVQALTGDEQLTDSFQYTISDGAESSTATVFITVTAQINAAPEPQGDTAQVDGGSTDNPIHVLENDTTEAGETLSILSAGNPTEGGSVRVEPGVDVVLYTPADGFLGTERFSYTVDDGRGGIATAIVTVQVTPGTAPLDEEIYASLSIFVDGEKLSAPPAKVGVIDDGFTSPIHTHEEDGRLHIHPVNDEARTEASELGDFFETWRTNAGDADNNPDAIFNQNQILDNLADANHEVRMFVNGVPNFEFENYVPESEDVIVISYESVSDAGTPTLIPIEDVTVEAGAPLHIPLDGFDFEGDALTFTATSGNPDLVETYIPEGNRSMRIEVAGFGTMTLELFEGRVPRVTDAITGLAESGTYDGVIFHRVIEDFMIQGGDPTGTGSGDPDIPDFDDQFHVDLQHTSVGVLSMAKTSQDDTNSSQFFITAGPTRHLDFNHSVFGRLIEGENVRRNIAHTPVDAGDRPLEDVVMTDVEIIVDNENGVLMLKAPEGASGETEVTVTVDDGHGGTSTRTFMVTVQSDDTLNGGPFLEDFPEIRTTVDTPVEIELRAVDVEGDAVVFDAAATGDTEFEFTLDEETGDDHTAVITVTPPAGFVGTLELGVAVRPAEASDTGNGFDWDVQFLDIAVDPQPSALMAYSAVDSAAGSEAGESSTTVMTAEDAELQLLLGEAIAAWQDALGTTETLDVELEVHDFDDGRLGEALIVNVGEGGFCLLGRVTIASDGGGVGWHMDSDTAPGPGEYDLYSVLLHEVGHVLGFSAQNEAFANLFELDGEGRSRIVGPGFSALMDKSGEHLDPSVYPDDLMNGTLAVGQRKQISPLDAQILGAVYAHGADTDDCGASTAGRASEGAEQVLIDEALSDW